MYVYSIKHRRHISSGVELFLILKSEFQAKLKPNKYINIKEIHLFDFLTEEKVVDVKHIFQFISSEAIL